MRNGLRLLLVALLSVGLCVNSAMAQRGKGGMRGQMRGGSSSSATPVVSTLTDAEITSLKHMYEEEKLAYEFYTAMYSKWNLAAFKKIARAESQHRTQLARQISLHGVDCTTLTGNPAGVYVDESFKTLLTQLLAQGDESLVLALKAAGLIEELDIVDLKKIISETAAVELKRVYSNLQAASENHLRSVVRQSSIAGGTYEAQLLSVSELQTIVSASSANSRRGKAGRDGRGNGRQGAGRGTGRGSSSSCSAV